MHDNYFKPESLEVGRGETVRFVVRNEGGLGHEFNIGTAAMHARHQEEMMMIDAIRDLLAQGPFHGEGYRKIWARLRFAGIRTSKRRVLPLTAVHGLEYSAPQVAGLEQSFRSACVIT